MDKPAPGAKPKDKVKLHLIRTRTLHHDALKLTVASPKKPGEGGKEQGSEQSRGQ